MALGFHPDTSVADWLVRSPTPPMELITLGPAGYDAYARLRFIPDPTAPGRAEADVAITADHPSDLDQARRALHLLARFTTTPGECYFCVWEGYSDIALPPSGPVVTLPHRRYALLRGSLTDIAGWEGVLGAEGPCAPPAFAWPADRGWCFTSDVDPHWAGIGAGRAAVEALVGDPGLDVVPAPPGHTPPAYR
ncbi:hypothetical protein Q5530_12190 [Saccharothrix sp. BKS2]|uniref:hypothetical protein n=1 Tax=Saccharothrix sp. BKS2 TaxID=3064400 RepID=UPI0039ED0E1E